MIAAAVKELDPALVRKAAQLDSEDELAEFRAEFYLDAQTVYLDGNSLGPLSRGAEAALLECLDAWKTRGIEGWTEGEAPWFFLASALAAQTASLIGAAADEVVVTNSTTVNLHQLLATLFAPGGDRSQILVDALAFPSDLYAIRSHLRLRGIDPRRHLVLVPSRNGLTLEEADIVAAMTERIALAVLPAVLYRSGQCLDMAGLTTEALRRGIRIGFDCSHSIGAVPHALDAWGVDFAFWCGYKYLNGGPGAAGGLYLNRRHFGREPGLAGWFSSDQARQFDMTSELIPAVDAGAMQIGTPNILSMAPLRGALSLIQRAGLSRMRRKSLALTGFLMELVDRELPAGDVEIVSPREAQRRGGHVTLRSAEAARIGKALRAEGVVPDHRPPDLVRLAPAPLYNTFRDCLMAVGALKRILKARSYEQIPEGRAMVP
jgi:kynureninase